MSDHKPWGGRFTEPTDAFVERFTASVAVDQRLYQHDIAGSIAHARMLAHCGVLTATDCDLIVGGLEHIRRDIECGAFEWRVGLEDVHMNVEAELIARVGDAGKRLHTARSRNDQVATATRLFTRDALDELQRAVRGLQGCLLERADAEADTIMPGFTHMQVAQPVTLGHHLLAWFEMLDRDHGRLRDARARLNVLPLGAAALAGTTYPIDRHYTASLLGFDSVAENSLDAVSDRDFALESAAAIALLMTHLSRISEELVLWSTPQFGFVDIADAFCTGSSIMPQKKNPDVVELIRGKTGRTYGALMTLLTIMKGQPLAYNKDNQEDKEPLFDTLDTASACLRAMTDLIPALHFNRARMREEARRGYATATDLADYLVKAGVPFREAHDMVGRTVRYAIEQHKDLAELSLVELQQFGTMIREDVFAILSLEGSVNARRHFGGTAPAAVREAIARARIRLQPGVPS